MDVTIHDIDPQLLEQLEARAKVFGRSLEQEMIIMIRRSMPKHRSRERLRQSARESHERFRGRTFSDSAEAIREDRER